MPENAESRYFLGYTIDRINSSDGEYMTGSNKNLTLNASEQFEKVNKLEEKYTGQLALLDPYSKLSSIWGSLAQAYLVRNLPDSAIWAFKEGKKRGGFIEPVLEYNRQLINSCKPNAILITTGDNITIPTWYLQTIEQVRPDVTVVDANLINSKWYPLYLKQSGKLKIGLTDVELDTINYQQWMAKEIKIKNPADTNIIFNWVLKPTYYDQYILRGDRILLDILKQNLYKRDFYFAAGFDSTSNLFLNDYMIDDGIVSRIILHKNDLTTETTIISKNLSAYNISNLSAKDIKKSSDAIVVLSGFRWTFFNNAHFLYSKGEVKEAKRLIEDMERRFPVDKLPYESEYFEQYVNTFRNSLK